MNACTTCGAINRTARETSASGGCPDCRLHVSINWPAVRAYSRLAEPVVEMHMDGARADAGYDAGEWSGAWHWEQCADRCQALAAIVASRFAIPMQSFTYMLCAADEVHSSRSTP